MMSLISILFKFVNILEVKFTKSLPILQGPFLGKSSYSIQEGDTNFKIQSHRFYIDHSRNFKISSPVNRYYSSLKFQVYIGIQYELQENVS